MPPAIYIPIFLRQVFHSFPLKKKKKEKIERRGLDHLCGNVFIFDDEIAPHCAVLQNEYLGLRLVTALHRRGPRYYMRFRNSLRPSKISRRRANGSARLPITAPAGTGDFNEWRVIRTRQRTWFPAKSDQIGSRKSDRPVVHVAKHEPER